MSKSIFDTEVLELTEEVNALIDKVNEAINDSPIYTKENLFERAVVLNEQLATIKADIKQLKEDFTWDADYNPKGLDKEVVNSIADFAANCVKESVGKVIAKAEKFQALKEELLKD